MSAQRVSFAHPSPAAAMTQYVAVEQPVDGRVRLTIGHERQIFGDMGYGEVFIPQELIAELVAALEAAAGL